MQRDDLQRKYMGTIAAFIRNQNVSKKKDLIDWTDIFPPASRAANAGRKRGMTHAEMLAITRAQLAAVYGPK